MKLQNRVVLVAGCASGLGAATARHFASLGARIIGIDRNAELGGRLQDEAKEDFLFVEADVTSEEAVSHAIRTGIARFGPLSGAVICAGVVHGEKVRGRKGPHQLDSFRRVVDINLIGTFNVVRLAVDNLATNEADADGERGVVLMTASTAAFEGQIGQAAYAAAKGAIVSMTLPMARELAALGIRVCTVAPGLFETAIWQGIPDASKNSLIETCQFPRRMGRPPEFALLAQQIFENPMLNGSVLRLDGALRMNST